MKRYRCHYFRPTAFEIERRLNQMAKEGWELHSTSLSGDGYLGSLSCALIFVREAEYEPAEDYR